MKGIIDYFSNNRNQVNNVSILAGFKAPEDMLFKKNIEIWKKNMDVTITVDSADEKYTGNIGLVTKYIEGIEIADKDNVQAIIVGPPMMMKFTVEEFKKRGISDENIWVSYERKMCCGVGKCGHCKIDDTYICLEGPVFKYNKAKELID